MESAGRIDRDDSPRRGAAGGKEGGRDVHAAGRGVADRYTVDIAYREDGEWLVVELGDGEVAEIPEDCDLHAFFAALATG